MDEICSDMIVNSGAHYVPAFSWTMEEEGVKLIGFIGKDKRQINYIC